MPLSNAIRRAILNVSSGAQPASVLRGTLALHYAAQMWEWDSQEPAALVELAQHPDLARGTLLRLYWHSGPGFYCQYANRAEAEADGADLEAYDTCQALAATYVRRTDLKHGIAFDPHHNDSYDMTQEYADFPKRSVIAPQMLVAVPGEAPPDFVGLDVLTRDPTSAERVAIAAAVERGRAALSGLAAGATPRGVVLAIAGAMGQAWAPLDDLAYVWLDQLGWPWRCGDSATDGLLLGVLCHGLTLYVPDITRRTIEDGVDPDETIGFFDLLTRQPTALSEHTFWDEAEAAFAYGWLVATG